jgi:hypothetical protein
MLPEMFPDIHDIGLCEERRRLVVTVVASLILPQVIQGRLLRERDDAVDHGVGICGNLPLSGDHFSAG